MHVREAEIGAVATTAPVRLYAAGSLRAALSETAACFEARVGLKVAGTFGASGLLCGRIAGGEPAEVFASANMAHPAALAASGLAGPVAPFARNRLCALARPDLRVDPSTLLDRMLDPDVRLGTSTPRADPSGDYAWALFEKAELQRPGAYAALDAKARQLTGGPASRPAPDGRNIYALNVADGNADIFLVYATAAAAARAENPALQAIPLPPELAITALYGIAAMVGARSEAVRFVEFVLSPAGQDILRGFGFEPADPATQETPS